MFNDKSSRRRPAHNPPPALERLEPRTLLAVAPLGLLGTAGLGSTGLSFVNASPLANTSNLTLSSGFIGSANRSGLANLGLLGTGGTIGSAGIAIAGPGNIGVPANNGAVALPTASFAGNFRSNSRVVMLSETNAAVQAGFLALASTYNLRFPASTDPVRLGNTDGLPTYTMLLLDSVNRPIGVTVDITGAQIADALRTTITLAELGNLDVSLGLANIAAAVGRLSPTSEDFVTVNTLPTGIETYTIGLARFGGVTNGRGSTLVTVDEFGNPVGNIKLPLAAFSPTIQDALIASTPLGANPLTPNSRVTVRTVFGVPTYTVVFKIPGEPRETVTIDADGNLFNPPSTFTTVFGDIPLATQNEFQLLAFNRGLPEISSDTPVRAYDLGNGVVLYHVKLRRFSYVVDDLGNPTILPRLPDFRF